MQSLFISISIVSAFRNVKALDAERDGKMVEGKNTWAGLSVLVI